MLPKRQRLIGLKAKGGKPANDDLPVSSLTLKEGQKIMMMGQPEAHVEALDKQSEVSQSRQNLVALVWPQRWLPRLTVAEIRICKTGICQWLHLGAATKRSLYAARPASVSCAGGTPADGAARRLLQCWSMVCPEAG